MTTLYQPIFDENKNEIGMVISAFAYKAKSESEKKEIEQAFTQQAFDEFYPNEGLNIFSNIENDVASITVIRNLDDLKGEKK